MSEPSHEITPAKRRLLLKSPIKKKDHSGQLVYSPSDLIRDLASPFANNIPGLNPINPLEMFKIPPANH